MTINALNALIPGWTESTVGGLICNPSIFGGIIDSEIVSGEWFIIFNDDREVLEGFETREDAIEAFSSSQIEHYGAR